MKEITISDNVYDTLRDSFPETKDFDSKIRKLLLNEGEKRNYQLQRIHKLYGDSYVLVHEGD